MSVALTIRRYRDEDHDTVWVLQHMAEGTLTSDEVPPARADDPDYGDFHRIDADYLRPRGEFLIGVHERQIVAIGALQWRDPVSLGPWSDGPGSGNSSGPGCRRSPTQLMEPLSRDPVRPFGIIEV
jgi:hypothetical protein